MQFTSSTTNVVPLPLIGEGLNALQVKARLTMSGATLPNCGERSVAALPGGAEPFAGRVALEGFTPQHRFKARTAASDGHTAFTRACASAPGSGLR